MFTKFLALLLFSDGLLLADGMSVGWKGNQFSFELNVPKDDSSTDDDKYSELVPEMIKGQGYRCEIHTCVTEDGFINTLHRIPPKASGGGGKVVFLQHGLLGTSADFVMGAPENSLGYVLADSGHDVWLGNARGNKYSRKHRNLTTSDREYWQFSFDEMGKHDIPAAVDYVLRTTRSERLVYVGHSMGTTMFWVGLNEHGDLSEKIEFMIAMGPVGKVAHMHSPIRFIAPLSRELQFLFRILGINEFAPNNAVTDLLTKYVCDETMIQLKLCENVLFLLTGYDNLQGNRTLLPYILGHEPGGTSTRTVVHFAQLVSSGRFCKFDHGSAAKNLEAYNSSTPPEYVLNKVDVPVVLMWADNDWLADTRDVQFLVKGLPNVKLNYEVPFANFNHVDFLWAMDARKLIFNPIRKLLQSP